MAPLFLAWTTVSARSDADRLAAEAIDRNLAVCVQIEGPVTSHYRWQGKTEQATEFRLCFKVLSAQLPALASHVLTAHPYDTPEWLVVPVAHVGEKYLSWAEANSTFPPFHSSHPPI